MSQPPNDVPICRIRPGTKADRVFVLAAAARLAAFPVPEWRSPGDIIAAERRTLTAYFDGHTSGTALFIAEDTQGQPLGFVYLETLRDYFTGESHGHVSTLAVNPEHEGQGVGQTLMHTAEAWAREQGFTTLTLTVFERNRRARALYDHLGYRPETLRYIKTL